MRKRIWTTLGYWALMGVVGAWAQESHKAGLWIIATTTRIQKAGESPGNFAHGHGEPGVAGGVPVCLTQEMIDTYGVILPPSLKGCELSNVVQALDNFRADMTCTGAYNGSGSVDSTWTDEEHVVGTVRFISKTRDEANPRAMVWVQDATAVFKSSDCGTVKPRKMPVK